MKSIGNKSNGSRGRVILASAALAILAFGCGKHSEDQQASASQGDATQAVAVEHTGPASTGASGSSQHGEQAQSGSGVSADSLPPEIAVSAPDTLITPGSVVEITASGSPDVVEMTLSDGLRKQPLTYDSSASVWRTFYRVPMRIRGDRVELSVTAKNGVNRWRRVWVFMDVPKGADQ